MLMCDFSESMLCKQCNMHINVKIGEHYTQHSAHSATQIVAPRQQGLRWVCAMLTRSHNVQIFSSPKDSSRVLGLCTLYI